ncbi:MAG TPA: helix-turn-helix transcriptional regulator [Propionibacteriaceae bacterium]
MGANLQLHRKAKGYSQSDLAGLLEQRGLPFQQQTILKIEKGSRPLKLEEAFVIADTLDIELSALTEQFTNDAIAAAATEILQRAAVIARFKKGIEETRERNRQREEENLLVIARFTRELREVEQRLADAGAVKDGDGKWRWRNEDGSYSYLTVDV